MSTDISIWDRFNIPKKSLSWLNDIIKEGIINNNKKTDVIVNAINKLRQEEYGDESLLTDVSDYEIKLFLVGKLFEGISTDDRFRDEVRKEVMQKKMSQRSEDEDDDEY